MQREAEMRAATNRRFLVASLLGMTQSLCVPLLGMTKKF
jgi:hypothetical protein